MVSINWFNELLPDKVESEKDMYYVFEFLKKWLRETENCSEILTFLNELKPEDKEHLIHKIESILSSYKALTASKEKLLEQYIIDNTNILSENTILTLKDFSIDYKAINTHVINAINCIYNILTA